MFDAQVREPALTLGFEMKPACKLPQAQPAALSCCVRAGDPLELIISRICRTQAPQLVPA